MKNSSSIKKNYTAISDKTGIKFSLGDKVKVKVLAVRPERREIDFSLEKEEAAATTV